MSWFSETYRFVLSILHFWIVLLTGSIVAAGIGAWEHSRGGLSWGLYRYILGLTLLVAVFLAWREQFRRVQGPAQRRSIREQLGAFIGEGHNLMARCADETQPAPEEEANAWAARVETFLAEHLGDSYVHRFRSGIAIGGHINCLDAPPQPMERHPGAPRQIGAIRPGVPSVTYSRQRPPERHHCHFDWVLPRHCHNRPPHVEVP